MTWFLPILPHQKLHLSKAKSSGLFSEGVAMAEELFQFEPNRQQRWRVGSVAFTKAQQGQARKRNKTSWLVAGESFIQKSSPC